MNILVHTTMYVHLRSPVHVRQKVYPHKQSNRSLPSCSSAHLRHEFLQVGFLPKFALLGMAEGPTKCCLKYDITVDRSHDSQICPEAMRWPGARNSMVTSLIKNAPSTDLFWSKSTGQVMSYRILRQSPLFDATFPAGRCKGSSP